MKQWMYLTLAVLLGACASSGGGQPDWATGGTKKYPQALYLTATGSASNVEDAKTAALANLAKIFEVQVDETSRDEASVWQLNAEGETLTGGSQLTARYIDSYTTKLLEGASIAETWQSKPGTQHIALAILSRGQLSNKLSAEIRKADRYVQGKVAAAKQSDRPLPAAQALYRGRSALKQREMLQRDLQIVDATGTGIRATWSVKDLETQIDRYLATMSVATETAAESAFAEQLTEALPAAVTAAGMQYVADTAPYRLQSMLDVEDLGQKDGWYWYRGALEVKLLEVDSGKVLASQRWPLKASGQSKDQSRVRLQDQIKRTLNTQLKAALLSFGETADK